MSNLESIIVDLRSQYVNWQAQFQIQIVGLAAFFKNSTRQELNLYHKDGLVKLNEDLQNEMVRVERKNEKLKEENLKLKSELKALNGERSIVTQDFEKEFLMPQTVEVI
jgi:hypothetical protein